MNDRYLFRAKRTDNGEWVEGLLTIMWGQIHIINPIDENTAYPIVKVSTNKGNTLCEVRYADSVAQFQLWQFTTLPKTATVLNLGNYGEEVIGNIFDNPELLEVGE